MLSKYVKLLHLGDREQSKEQEQNVAYSSTVLWCFASFVLI